MDAEIRRLIEKPDVILPSTTDGKNFESTMIESIQQQVVGKKQM